MASIISIRSCFQRQQSRGAGGIAPPQKKKIGGGRAHPCFGAEKHFYTYTFYITCEISDLRAHISALRRLKNYLRSTMKQDRLNKLDTDALSQIDYGHSRHCEDWKEVCLCQLKTPKVFWKIWVRVPYGWVEDQPSGTSRNLPSLNGL